MSRPPRLLWRELHWARPLDDKRALAFVRQLAADPRSPLLALEARGTASGISYFLASPPAAARELDAALSALVPGTALTNIDLSTTRRPSQRARQLKVSTRHRALRSDDLEATSRSVLSALAAPRDQEVLVLQLVLGPRRVPLAIPTKSPSSIVAPWWFVLSHGNGGLIDSEKRTALRGKVSDHGFACAVRIGVSASTPGRRAQLAEALLTAVRTAEAAGLRFRAAGARPIDVDRGRAPRIGWPLRLNAQEVLALTAWPFGDTDFPGTPALHPRRLPADPVVLAREPSRQRRVLAASLAPGSPGYLTQTATDALRHTHVMAPTGAGKSVLLGRLIQQDIAAGRAVVLIEPKGDLVEDVLARIPRERSNDVVVLDPAAEAPVGLNPLISPGRSPEVIADALLTVFRAIYADAWGPRLQDLLHASLLTLARRSDTSRVMLPLLLTNTGFRRSLTRVLHDPIALGPFWAWFESLSEAERGTVIAPLMNKLRPWLFSPRLRAVLGQREPRFDIRQVFTERRILLVPLRNGVIGPEVSRLLGSLVVAQLWQTIQSRVAIPTERRHSVGVYIDEVSEYLHLPTDLGDALAQARGLGVGFTLAHQHLHQLPIDVRAGVLANARSRVLFQLNHDDALAMAKGHPEIAPEDFTSLGAYELYASLYADGQVRPYAAGSSLPPGPPTANPAALRIRSQSLYGRPLSQIDAGFADLLGGTPNATDAPTGRRRRGGAE